MVDLIINTPKARQGRRDVYEIRRAAVDIRAGQFFNTANSPVSISFKHGCEFVHD